jgi:DNA-binding transcriptional regulator YdaS (Cro superfamily)
METGIAKAIRLAGSQTALGNLLGLTPQAIQKWAAQGTVPGDRCREVETKLNGQVTRYELNPTVFGDPPQVVAPESQPQ